MAFTAPQQIPGTPTADAEAPHVVRSGDNVFVLWHEFPPNFDPNDPQPDIFLARSTDRGVTFRPRINLSDSRLVPSDQEEIAVSGNRVYVVWIEGGDVAFRRDRDNDGTFSDRISLNDATTGSNPSNPQIVASGNNVFVVWEALLNGQSDIFYARSSNGGDSFMGRRNLSASAEDSFAPAIALLGDDRVIVTWRQGTAGQGFEIFFVRGQ